MLKKEIMVELSVGVANDDTHGYSQIRRWPYQGTDFDCSALMIWSAHEAGYDVPLSGYTGTMLADFTAAGFTAIPFDNVGLGGLERGDILLNVTHHTEMYIGDGLFVGAHSSEDGGIDGEPGDQTGNEISVCNAYVYWDGWDYVLRPPIETREYGNESEENEMVCIFRPNEEGYLVYYDGTVCHPLAHPDEVEAIEMVYKNCTGRDIPKFELGNKDAPWATRFFEAVQRTF